jgi:predicted permease
MPTEMRRWTNSVRRNPGFYTVAIGTLALGIGATTAIFSIVDMALLRPLPFPEPDRALLVWDQAGAGAQALLSVPEYLELRDQLRSFEHFAANWGIGLDTEGTCVLSGGGKERETVPCAAVTYNFFSALGVKPLLGRDFTEPDERYRIPQTVILSHQFWKRRFGGDAGVIGQSIQSDGATVTVIGVMPPMFELPTRCQLWFPPPFDEQSRKARGGRFLRCIARTKPGVSLQQAQREFDTIAQGVVIVPARGAILYQARLMPLQEVLAGDTRMGLLAIQASAVILLLIACCNIANLLLALAAARSKEMAIRMVAGATPARLIGQTLRESLALALAGGVAGTLLAYWALRILIVLSPVQIPRLDEVGIDVRVLLFTLFVCALAGCIFGVAPALTALSIQPRRKLVEGGRGGTSAGGSLSAALVVVEISLALVLACVAGLTFRSFVNLQRIQPGFDARNALKMELLLPFAQDREAHSRTLRTVLETVAALPGVEAAATAQDLPLGGWQRDFRFRLRKEPNPDPNQSRSALLHGVSLDYFRAMGIPLKSGRGFVAGDKMDGVNKRVVLINEELARQSFAGQDPVGRYLYSGPAAEYEIVGVAGNVRHRDLGLPPQAELYMHGDWGTFLIVRSKMEPTLLAAEVRKAIHAANREVGVTAVATLEQTVRQAGARPRFWMILTAVFALLSLAMAAAGVYALVSHSVRRRVPEFAIRMALGARPAGIRNLILGQTLRRTLVGVVAGVAASLALARILSSLLFEVQPYDPVSLAAAVLLVTATSLLASYLPARWAARADPAAALREE